MQGNKVRFEKFRIKEGKIDFTCNDVRNDVERSLELYFHFDKPIIPSNDAIAVALSAMCRVIYKEIYIDLEINNKVIEEMKKFNKSEISCKRIIQTIPNSVGEDYSLNFSGGFDSLAAMYLLPDVRLVSVDFQETQHQRERDFFSLFDTNIVSTNARKYGFPAYYGFCGIGSILWADYLGIKAQFSGNILEEGPYNLREGEQARSKIGFSTAYGIKHYNLTTGFTEVGTTTIVCHYAPDYVNKSLISLANPRTEKRYRKQLLVQIVSKKLNKEIEIDKTLPPKNPYKWGEYFATDFLGIYILKKLGADVINKYLKSIPNEIFDLSNQLTLSFYEKFNTNYLYYLPVDIRGTFLSRMADAGIMPYNERDWKELRIVADCLSKHYPRVNKQ